MLTAEVGKHAYTSSLYVGLRRKRGKNKITQKISIVTMVMRGHNRTTGHVSAVGAVSTVMDSEASTFAEAV